MNTDELIKEVSEALDNATDGPWYTERYDIGPRSNEDDQSYGMMLPVARIEAYDYPQQWEHNANLIANAPQWLTELRDRLVEERKRADEYERKYSATWGLLQIEKKRVEELESEVNSLESALGADH